MAAHKQTTVDTITAMLHSAPLLFLAGVLAVTAGIAIVLTHNVWSGGVTPVLVTLVGWVALVKGLLLLFLSPEAESAVSLAGLQFERLFYVYTGTCFAIGAWLTYQGFTKRA
jgi:vacuolar-type H+-ATPase subunit I/STV1